MKNIKIALAGNPNCGKTTLFNALTGSNQFVGNWPGVTVEKKEGKLKKNDNVSVVDLPGIYSLSPYTLEEVVARNFLVEESPDVILNIVDATNLERNLYLTTQLAELGIPVVIALNMMDVVRKRGDVIDTDKLSKKLGCKIVEISALKNDGINEAVEAAISVANSKSTFTIGYFSGVVEHALAHIEEATVHGLDENKQRWYSIKIFERDSKAYSSLNLDSEILSHIEQDILKVEKSLDDDAESIITNERYLFVESILKDCYKKKHKGLSTSDKIDRIVTNRFLALPIFAVIMFLVYFVSVTTVGTWATDFMNDELFGDGFEFFGIWVDGIPVVIGGWLNSINCAEWLQGLILNGIVAGVGAVLGFVPQILMLFVFLAFLEACGYMARVAFVLDRLFRKLGLSGKSFIPMLIGTGCSVPGIMASRTIESERDRRMTIIATPFIPCGAKLPFIAMVAGVIFGGAWWVAPLAWFTGFSAVIISGLILKKFKAFKGEAAHFVLELPSYHMPTLSNVLKSTWERGWSFVKKAATIILISTVAIWFTSYFGVVNGTFRMLEDSEMQYSILAFLGSLISWIFYPIGFGNWQSAIATITGFVAKENIVSTMSVLYGGASEIQSAMTAEAGLSFMIFNLLCAPCFAAMGATRREMNSGKWTLFAFGYQTMFAYLISFVVFHFASLFTGNIVGAWGVIAVILAVLIVALIVYLLVRPNTNSEKVVKE